MSGLRCRGEMTDLADAADARSFGVLVAILKVVALVLDMYVRSKHLR
jgi:hypothetical protein